MVYYASSGSHPSLVSSGPSTLKNPYYNKRCGCGSANPTVQLTAPVREGFEAGAPVVSPSQPSMCTLTATAPPASCCAPAPLHCDCCNGSGYFRASEAYGS